MWIRRLGLTAAFVIVTLGWATRADAQSVTLYGDINFSGGSFTASSDQSFVGWDWNDLISSMSIPPGWSVTIYQHSDFGGDSRTLEGDVADLRHYGGPGPDGTWNDQISSVRISGSSGPPGPTTNVVLVNGSFNTTPPWVQPGSEYFAIGSTYQVAPVHCPWTDNGFAGVNFPHYGGILNGALEFANCINSLPPGEVNVITHSHGGNVAILGSWLLNRPIAHLINLGTPVNWDMRFHTSYPGNTVSFCTASAWSDWVQFVGASPFQVGQFAIASYVAFQAGEESANAFMRGDDALGFYWAGVAAAAIYGGYEWWRSTKEEWSGWTLFFDGLSHGQMHSPIVWNQLPSVCKR